MDDNKKKRDLDVKDRNQFIKKKGLICIWSRMNCLNSHQRKDQPERASHSLLHYLRKASFSVEAAMILPIFLFGMITVISFMEIPAEQLRVLVSVCENAKEKGLTDSGNITVSERSVWRYRPVQLLLPLPFVSFTTEVTLRCWSGEQGEKAVSGLAEMVYVTEHGSVYHLDASCTYLKLSVTEVGGEAVHGLRNKSGAVYHSCEICGGMNSSAGTVYITDYGIRYHSSPSCSAIKRSVHLIPVADTEGLHSCSKCGTDETEDAG